MYELVARNADSGEQLPDVDELNAFLMRLRTGMNANPRFISPRTPPPNLMDARNSVLHLPQQERNKLKTGTFEATMDMRLYGAFCGSTTAWLASPNLTLMHPKHSQDLHKPMKMLKLFSLEKRSLTISYPTMG